MPADYSMVHDRGTGEAQLEVTAEQYSSSTYITRQKHPHPPLLPHTHTHTHTHTHYNAHTYTHMLLLPREVMSTTG